MMDDPAAPTRILVVEDDPKLAGLVQDFLQANGFVVEVEIRGDRAPQRILEQRPALVVLDLMLPGLDGLSICRQVRSRYEGAILMLTARGEEVDEVVGLEVGADDYMSKPVRPRLLLARINTLLRRLSSEPAPADPGPTAAADPHTIRLGDLTVEAASRTVTLGKDEIHLTTAEFDLLWLLACHAGEVLSRDQIYSELRGIAYDGLDRSVDLRIARLRKKMGDLHKPYRMIKSVRGTGYLMARAP